MQLLSELGYLSLLISLFFFLTGDPTPYVMKNGSVMLAFGAGDCHVGLETIGVAMAETWDGPYSLLNGEPIWQLGDTKVSGSMRSK